MVDSLDRLDFPSNALLLPPPQSDHECESLASCDQGDGAMIGWSQTGDWVPYLILVAVADANAMLTLWAAAGPCANVAKMFIWLCGSFSTYSVP